MRPVRRGTMARMRVGELEGALVLDGHGARYGLVAYGIGSWITRFPDAVGTIGFYRCGSGLLETQVPIGAGQIDRLHEYLERLK